MIHIQVTLRQANIIHVSIQYDNEFTRKLSTQRGLLMGRIDAIHAMLPPFIATSMQFTVIHTYIHT